MIGILESPVKEFKTTLSTMLRVLVDKKGSVQEQMCDVGRKMEILKINK